MSLRGVDPNVYYRGNTLNCGQSNVRQLIISALQYWAEEYQVDGFYFSTAESMTQDEHGTVLDAPPLLEEIALDPVLGDLTLIASVGDEGLLPRLGERGFPHWGVWSQENGWFSRNLQAWMDLGVTQVELQLEGRGEEHSAGPQISTPSPSIIATRLTGSADLLAGRWDTGLPGSLAIGRSPFKGINSIQGKRSSGQLITKAEEEASLVKTAEQSLLTATVMSQGTPLLDAAQLDQLDEWELVTQLLALRKKTSDMLQPIRFDTPRQIKFHSSLANEDPNWDSTTRQYLAYCVTSQEGSAIYIGYNPQDEEVIVSLPSISSEGSWQMSVCVGDCSFTTESQIQVCGKGSIILEYQKRSSGNNA
eukprot:TRINITY_DN3939_c0_g1_i4.p1 TRINITY_DN3939_c0_g1~~TRINITY_DN3939_c0_g1_i4.p1  ORF type:complete len:390 (-),score=60.05 TRINITY_DN3939_c0_g1_i4:233-1321(-)